MGCRVAGPSCAVCAPARGAGRSGPRGLTPLSGLPGGPRGCVGLRARGRQPFYGAENALQSAFLRRPKRGPEPRSAQTSLRAALLGALVPAATGSATAGAGSSARAHGSWCGASAVTKWLFLCAAAPTDILHRTVRSPAAGSCRPGSKGGRGRRRPLIGCARAWQQPGRWRRLRAAPPRDVGAGRGRGALTSPRARRALPAGLARRPRAGSAALPVDGSGRGPARWASPAARVPETASASGEVQGAGRTASSRRAARRPGSRSLLAPRV